MLCYAMLCYTILYYLYYWMQDNNVTPMSQTKVYGTLMTSHTLKTLPAPLGLWVLYLVSRMTESLCVNILNPGGHVLQGRHHLPLIHTSLIQGNRQGCRTDYSQRDDTTSNVVGKQPSESLKAHSVNLIKTEVLNL